MDISQEIAFSLAKVNPGLYQALLNLVMLEESKDSIMTTIKKVPKSDLLESSIEVTLDFLIAQRNQWTDEQHLHTAVAGTAIG